MNNPDNILSSEITPEPVYRSRRAIVCAGILAGTVAATGWVYRQLNPRPATTSAANLPPAVQGIVRPSATQPAIATLAADDSITPIESITHYNNFYEFDTDKGGVADAAARFVSRPWTVAVDGLCAKPKVFDLDDLLKISPPEERIYRMRCVEAWSMVIPWVGFPLAKLLERVEPTSAAKYVAFQTLFNPAAMPNQQSSVLPWPYREGLRMDEAMHPLTILASGLYGRQLPPQDGAPLRLVVPWKYGFKGIKSIVKISLSATQPTSTWNVVNPPEYGFYSNVNPNVDHPRWSQATENRLGDAWRRPTLMFNGYGEQVAHLYAGMDPAGEAFEWDAMKDARFAKFVVLVNGAVPLAVLAWDAFNKQLGANPSQYALHTTGMIGLIFLCLSLCVTPVRKLTGYNALSHFRRSLGLYAFFYGVIHLVIWFVFDQSGNFRASVSDTLKRPFILVGMVTLLILIPLAVTSTNVMIKQMGAARWKRLHRLAYVAAIGGAAHYYMLVKADVRLPLAFAGVVATLLGYRVIAGAKAAFRKRAMRIPA